MHLHTELKKNWDRQKKKLNKSLKSWTQFESSPAEQLTETHWGLQMQIKPVAYVSLRKRTNSFIQKYIWLMEMSSIFSWCFFSFVDAWMLFFRLTFYSAFVFFFCFFFRSGWQHHDNAASTSATAPLHGCTLGVILCPPTHWFPLMPLREPGLSWKTTVAAEEEKGNGSSQRPWK